MNEEKEAFVARELDDFGHFLSGLFLADIQKKRLKDSGEFEKNFKGIAYKVDAARKTLTFQFENYGRFLEIRYHKKATLIKSIRQQARRDVWGIKTATKSRKRKDTRWYSANLYGSINRLIGHISWGYTEEIAAQLKADLEKGNSIFNIHEAL